MKVLANYLKEPVKQFKIKQKKNGVLSMFLSTLSASSLWNMFAGKGIVREGYGYQKGKGIIRASYGSEFNF